MSRPYFKDPVWASATNWPSGSYPWSGSPNKVFNTNLVWDPLSGISSEFANYLQNRDELSMRALADASGDIAAQNWAAKYKTFYASASSAAVAYDKKYRRWLSFGHVTGTNLMGPYQSFDGENWQALGTPFSTDVPFSVAVRPSDALAVVACSDGAGGNSFITFDSSNAHLYVATSGSGGPILDTGAVVYFSAASLFVTIGQRSGTAVAKSSPDGLAWTDRSGTLVAGFGGGSQVRTHFAQSPTRLLCFAQRAAGYTSYERSDDGTSWTTGTIGLTGSEIVKGAGYDDARGLFVVAVSDGTNSRTLTSTDGVSWTASSTLTGYVIGSFAVAGSQWLAFANGPLSSVRALYSSDAGVTWRVCCYVPIANTDRVTTNGYQYVSVAPTSPVSLSSSTAIGPADAI